MNDGGFCLVVLFVCFLRILEVRLRMYPEHQHFIVKDPLDLSGVST